MRRRAFIGLLGAAALPLGALAQQVGSTKRVAVILGYSQDSALFRVGSTSSQRN